VRKRLLLNAACLSLVLTGVGAVAGPALGVAATASARNLASDKVLVQYLAQYDPRSVVRIGAWQALLSSAPDAAVEEFLATGYDYAVGLAAAQSARNMDFAKRILATYIAEFAPEVHAAAQFAVNSRNDADRAQFANGGFAAAAKRDSAVRTTQGNQAKALAEADRTFVRNLAANDPGAQVRVSAAYATRVGSTDADLVDFFASGWAFGAQLDLDAYRQQGIENDLRWRATLNQLVDDATAAEQAARDAGADVAQQAKAAAVQAWQAVGTQTAPARSYWDEAQQLANTEVSNWAAVAAAASAASGPNWAAMVQPAQTNGAGWTGEQDFAAQQAQYWQALLQQALDGEHRVNTAS
jgi:hypothetical protein